jgi:hypothetical protein
MQIRARVVAIVKAGEECTHPQCALFKLCRAPHRHAFDVTLLELDPEAYADKLRAEALGVDLWKDDDRTTEPDR